MGTDPHLCGRCGHHLGSGLFCTECGRPAADDWRTGTAERPAVVAPPPIPVEQPGQPVQPAPLVQPPVVDAPPSARFPLFADEAEAPVEPATAVAPVVHELPASEPDLPLPLTSASRPPATRTARQQRRVDALPWLVGAAGLALVAMLGALLLVGGEEEQLATRLDESAARAPVEPETSAAAPPPVSQPPVEETEPVEPAAPAALTRTLGVEVPATAEPNQDVDGNLVRYEATNMLDEVAGTCWRMPGSAAGSDIVLTLPEPAEVTEVGLVNGYAKTSGDFDWYNGNRRVLEVEWVFDDGSTVRQSLGETRDLQTVPVEAVTTSTVTMRILGVSEPGRGRSARDYTAISDVAVVGSVL